MKRRSFLLPNQEADGGSQSRRYTGEEQLP
jgi:hypothetical protein